jgi:lantibiotic biosynthesis protein
LTLSPGDGGTGTAGASAVELSRTLLRDAQDELASRWDPFAAMDLSVAMLEAQKVGVDDLSPAACFLSGLDALRDTGILRPWLYRGAAQIGWTATQLHRSLGLRITNLEAIDELILSWIDDYPSGEDAELLFGIAGLGAYGLEHVSPVLARRIVSGTLKVIGERLESSADGSYVRLRAPRWDSQGASRRLGWKAVGVAHGNAGIAAFLAGVVRSGLGLEDRAGLMLGDVARWLVSVASHDSVYVFDSYAETGKRRGRSSWCHGDPGIALALASVARALDDPQLSGRTQASSDMAARAVLSRPASLAGVVDCCICHGAAFLYYFGGRMSHLGQRESDSFAEQWNAYIRERRRHGELLYQASGGMKRDASFLGGDSGVVCALTRSIHRQPAAWERLLLVS